MTDTTDKAREDADDVPRVIKNCADHLREQLGAARREIERLQAIVDDRLGDAAKLFLLSAGPNRHDGTFDINVQGAIIPLIAAHLAAEFKALGGENYVQMQFTAHETGPLTLTVQRDFGKLPAQIAREEKARADTAEALVARMAGALDGILANDGGDGHYDAALLLRARAEGKTALSAPEVIALTKKETGNNG